MAAAEPLPGDPVMGLRSLEDGFVPRSSTLEARPQAARLERGGRDGARRLLDMEGVFAGVSSGAVRRGAPRGRELDEGVVVCVLADGGWRYLSADFWQPPESELDEAMEAERLVVIPAAVRDALEAHAREEAPNEACGLIVLRDGQAVRYERGRNRLESPYRFELDIDPELWFLEDDGYELAVVHSHPASPAKPSRTDVERIGFGRAVRS